MQSTVTGIFQWSRWQPDRNLFFNSFFVEHADGNCAIDPLPLDESDAADIERRGGIAWIVVTNRDHLRDAAALRERFGAKLACGAADVASIDPVAVDRVLHDGDTIAGARVIALDGLKTPGEFALVFRDLRTALVGDALWGDPAGSVRMMPDDKLADPARAALSLRRVAACFPRHLLVGDGANVFGNATAVIWAALEARADCYVNKINLDELTMRREDDAPTTTLRDYNCTMYADAGGHVGAEKLGYNYAKVPPGASFCPVHWHTREEELFLILSGTATLRTPRGEFELRARDVVAFPTRLAGAHQVIATGTEPCELILIANGDPGDVCLYPESKKLLVEAIGLIVRDNPELDYFDGE